MILKNYRNIIRNRYSWYFNLDRPTVRRMLFVARHMRVYSRLMIGLFAMQILVGGFCLLTSEAHAMSHSVQTHEMSAHCTKSVDGDHQHSQDHAGNCYHCDQPDELSNSAFSSTVSMDLTFSDVSILPAALLSMADASGLLSTRTPTGPPRSSTLLYTTTQRILI